MITNRSQISLPAPTIENPFMRLGIQDYLTAVIPDKIWGGKKKAPQPSEKFSISIYLIYYRK